MKLWQQKWVSYKKRLRANHFLMLPSRGGVFYDIAATDTSKLKRALLIISSISVCGWLDDEQARSVRNLCWSSLQINVRQF